MVTEIYDLCEYLEDALPKGIPEKTSLVKIGNRLLNLDNITSVNWSETSQFNNYEQLTVYFNGHPDFTECFERAEARALWEYLRERTMIEVSVITGQALEKPTLG